MVNKVQDILISIFGWVIGPMVSAILMITVMNYKAQLEGNKILEEYKNEQIQETKEIVGQLYRDSLAIIELREYVSFTISVLRKSNPELYEQMVAEEIGNNKKAILPKKKVYLTDTKLRLR